MLFARKGRGWGSVRALPIRRALRGAQERYDGTPFEIYLPDGGRLRFGLGAPAIKVHFGTWVAAYDAWLRGHLGVGEAYVRREVGFEGDLEDGLTALTELFLQGGLEGLPARAARSLRRDREEDVALGDAYGDDFHRLYLDRKLQRSCGYFRTPSDSLDVAQEQRLAHTLRRLALRPGQRLLDIGCGWGHLMLQAAETHGVECLGITRSEGQAAYVREQAAARRLPVRVRVMDHLELEERAGFERVVSVGMMSPGGERRIDRFWDKVKALLSPGGICLLHCVAVRKESPGADPFVPGHAFPGHWLGSLDGVVSRAADRGLHVLDVENLRRHAALTAHAWRQSLLRRHEEIQRAAEVSEASMRAWDFHLASVVAGFRAGHLSVLQTVLSHGLQDDYPLTREALHAGERGANGLAARWGLRMVPPP